MIPYSINFCEEKIKDYKKYISPTQLGEFTIKYSNENMFDGYLYNEKERLSESPIELYQGEELWMRISPHEIQGCFESIKRARGKVGVIGLGLGYFTEEVLKKDDVTEVVVYEISQEIIDLYKNNFGENSKLRIVQGDGFKAEGEEFDFFFVDIYQYNISLDVVEHYELLNNLHKIEEYSFWAVEYFLLSCPLHELAWVFIPENWMDMSQALFIKFSQSKYLEKFVAINEEKALEILHAFNKIL